MRELLMLLGIQNWKPLLTALVMPPVPLLLCILLGVRGLSRQRRWGGYLIWSSLGALWLTSCAGLGRYAEHHWLSVPPVLSRDRIGALRTLAAPGKVAIVVLGGGKDSMAPEYGTSNLSDASLERLRYGLWLSRATDLPIAFSGGVGWGQIPSESEAEVAARIAKEEFGQALTWIETSSRDTRENALLSVPLLQNAGIDHLIIVTHGWHMPRAVRAFEHAAEGTSVRIEAAPMGLAATVEAPALEWVPTADGFLRVRRVARELLGHAMGV